MDDPKAKKRKLSTKSVTFARGPEPIAAKYRTDDGHPDHEGLTARQRRMSGLSWGTDLTPNNIRLLEKELGDECKPSIDRLKRRAGMLPLRKRPKEYLTWLAPPESDTESSEQQEDGPDDKTEAVDSAAQRPHKKQNRTNKTDASALIKKYLVNGSGSADLSPGLGSIKHRKGASIDKSPALSGGGVAATTSMKLGIASQSPGLGRNGVGMNGNAPPKGVKRLGGLNDPVIGRRMSTAAKK